ncbi:hypothetical protein [Klebsiella quasivariicola]|uniref:hypothetical protein n=1 Tax=Klebsiella quasivariicola TaxID=2026240 RepID=UPI002479FEEB|nr:hypothetical protein [Klebsiella quasivariicola]
MSNGKVEIKEVKTSLAVINKVMAFFNCDNTIKGIIHIDEKTTVVLDGGYVLGRYCCSLHAMEALGELYVEIDVANSLFGMNYEDYKKVFTAGASTKFH